MKAKRSIHRRFSRTIRTALLVAACTVFPSPGPAQAAEGIKPLPNPYTPSFSGKALVHCHCVLGTTGCQSSFLWQAAGAQVHDWRQENFFTQGKEIDLAEACYRKRDVEKLGSMLCCPVDTKDGKPEAVMLHKFFAASEVVPQP